MKRLIGIILFLFLCVNLFAQQVVLTFSGQDIKTANHVKLSRIEIIDVTQGWTETLIYPDTEAVLTVTTNIPENERNFDFGFEQNTPNPFQTRTNVNLNIIESGSVTMELTNMNGQVAFPTNCYLLPGKHQFEVSLANTGTYIFTAHQNGKTSSIKMINNGNGESNSIKYVGENSSLWQVKSELNHLFSIGDVMTYQGFAEKYGYEVVGAKQQRTQISSAIIDLKIDYDNAFNPTDSRPCDGDSMIWDWEGNAYLTVQIGNQCWMRENLRTTHYADGTLIPQGSTTSNDVGYWYYPDNNPDIIFPYGLLYNWPAMVPDAPDPDSSFQVQGICPDNWHVPSRDEWEQLLYYVKNQEQYSCMDSPNYIAKAMSDTIGWAESPWHSCSVGSYPLKDNNSTGFSALPAGDYHGVYDYLSYGAEFWSSTQFSNSLVFSYFIGYTNRDVAGAKLEKYRAYSVRCVRNEHYN